MLDFSTVFKQHLQTDTVRKIDEIPEKNIDIFLFNTVLLRDFSILSTSGLSNFSLPYREEEQNGRHIELCFALPSYWDDQFKNENAVWVLEKLKFLCNYLLDKNTHFWDGHTMPNAKPNRPFSKTMKQEYLFFSKSILYPDLLTEVQIEDKTVTLLFLIPIFQKEWEHKLSRGTGALKKKLVNANAGEILDDYRNSTIKKLFGIF
jgi:hypothetical protein